MVSSYILLGLTQKLRKFYAKYRQIQLNFPKTLEIRGKMSNILAKWLHYLWLFPNIWGNLINLVHLHGIFPKIQEILIKIHHSFTFNYTKLQISCVLLASKINANANLNVSGINHSNAKCI